MDDSDGHQEPVRTWMNPMVPLYTGNENPRVFTRARGGIHLQQNPPHPNVRDPMFDMVRYPPEVIVEVGSQHGNWAFRALEQNPDSVVFCVDPWEETGVHGSSSTDDDFALWISHHFSRLGRRVWPIRMKSVYAAKIFFRPVDLLFIDGLHTEEGVYDDLVSWVPKVKTDGLVVLHDYEIPEVSRGIDRYISESGVNAYFGDANWKTSRKASKVDCWFWR